MCSELYIFASILPWFSPVLNAFLYSFIGKRFRTNLTRLFQSDKTIRRCKLIIEIIFQNFFWSVNLNSVEKDPNQMLHLVIKNLQIGRTSPCGLGTPPTMGTRLNTPTLTPIDTTRSSRNEKYKIYIKFCIWCSRVIQVVNLIKVTHLH